MSGDKSRDIKPMNWARKSEIAERADTLEARAEAKAEAKKEAEANTQEYRLVFGTSGTYPDGTKWERDATPEEQAEYESFCV